MPALDEIAGFRSWNHTPILALLHAALLAIVPGWSLAQWGVSHQEVVFEDQAIDGGGQFSSFLYPQMNDDSTVSFVGFTSGLAACSSTVNLFKSVSGVIQPPLCVDTLAGGGRGTIMNANDDLLFQTLTAIKSEAGGLHDVASTSIEVPGFPGEKFDLLNQSVINGAGQVSFWASTDLTNANGIWSEPSGPGSLTDLVLEGDPAPGLPEGTVFTSIVSQELALSDTGEVAFQARTSDPPPTGQPLPGVWVVSQDGDVRKVFAQNDPAPGSTGNFNTTSNRPPSINANGEVAIFAVTTNINEQGIWAQRWNANLEIYELHNVVLTGTEVRIAENQTWIPLEFHSPTINSNGDVGFVGCSRLTISRICGIVRATWNGTGYDLQPVVLDYRITGARRDPHGAGFSIATTQKYNMNALGQFAFGAQTENFGANYGLWGWRPDIGLRRIFVAGQPFRTADGEIRIPQNTSSIPTIFVSGGEDGRPRILNNSGLVVFKLDFEPVPPEVARKEGIYIGDLNETLFLDSLEWRWTPDG